MSVVQRDRRQEILDRLWAIFESFTLDLAGGPNGPIQIKTGNAVQNRSELQKEQVPGIILLDADEVKDPQALRQAPGSAQARMPAQVMKMTPEIYVVLDTRSTPNKNVGKDLNTVRLAILNRIFTDSQLQSIVGQNGNIVYDGCVTDLARNRQMKGQLGISVTFSYPLILAEYVAS